METNEYCYPAILIPEHQPDYYTLQIPDLNKSLEHFYFEDLPTLHETASSLIYSGVESYTKYGSTPPTATAISDLKVHKGTLVFEIYTDNPTSIYISTGEEPKYIKSTGEKIAIFQAIALLIAYAFYFYGTALILGDRLPMIFTLALSCAPLIAFYLQLKNIKSRENELYFSLCCTAIYIIIFAGYGFFNMLTSWQAPGGICWIFTLAYSVVSLIALIYKEK